MHGEQEHAFQVGVTRDIVLSDGTLVLGPTSLQALDRPGLAYALLEEDRRELAADQLVELDALVHFSPVVSEASLRGVERLTLIARLGVGLDLVDLDACTEHGIAVTITPSGVTRAMASAAVALVLALSHRLVQRHERLVTGKWAEGRLDMLGLGLTGRTLGVIGYGRIGRELVRLLRPWDLRVIVTQRSDPRDREVDYAPLESLLGEADIVVVACPLTPETHHLLDARRLALMKPTAFVVNVARGPVIDQAALVDALQNGRLAGAGLDVYEHEPPDPSDPILTAPGFVGAPHSLGYWDELFQRSVADACAAVLDVAAGSVPRDVANPAVLESRAFEDKLARFGAGQGPP